MKRRLHIINDEVRLRAMEAIADAPVGVWITIQDHLDRNQEQSRKFHAICNDFVKAGWRWAGKRPNARQVKILLISAHTIATKDDALLIEGLEGEPVLIRESTADMTIDRMASLIEFAQCYAAMNGIELSE